MEILKAVGVFVAGLGFGSFVNLVVYRLLRSQSVLRPRSYCDHCKEQLTFCELIPVIGYFWAKGKCLRCEQTIRWRYPLTELGLGVLWLTIFLKFGFSWYGLGGLVFSALLLICALTDWENGLIFNAITYPGIILGLLFAFGRGELGLAFGGMLLLGGIYLLILLVSRGGMGGGDVKMGVMIGAFCGTEGIFITFILSSLLAAVYVFYLMLRRKAKRKMEIPFGIFLSLGSYLAYVFGTEFMTVYLQTFANF